MTVKKLALTLLSCALTTTSAFANNAVSDTNGKLEFQYGERDGREQYSGSGSIAFPVGNDYGIQLDLMSGESENAIETETVQGFGGHFFWRDNQVGLLGLTASFVEQGSTNIESFGLEGEYYLDDFTVLGSFGEHGGDIASATYANIGAHYYVDESFMLKFNANNNDSDNLYTAGLEYQLGGNKSDFVLFASASTGDNSVDSYSLGLKYFFGESKTLKRKYREDDPENILPMVVTSNSYRVNATRTKSRINSYVTYDNLGVPNGTCNDLITTDGNGNETTIVCISGQ